MDETRRIAELEQQIAELRAANDQLSAKARSLANERIDDEGRRQRLAAIAEASRDAIWSWDIDGIITFWNEEAERLLQYPAGEIIGRSLLTLVPPERMKAAGEAMAKLRDGRWIGQFETVRLRRDGTPVEVEMTVSPIHDADGQILGAATVCRDITERRQAEARQELLMRELDHRVKNTVATVLALMHQTQRNSTSLEEFVQSFELRLRTLIRTHDALMKSDFMGAQLQDLIAAEMEAFCPDSSEAVVMECHDVLLHWRSAQMISLGIHELASNAARHGALSVEGGRIRLASSIDPDNTEHRIRLEWREERGPRIGSIPARSGFGRTLLERGLPAALHGSATLEFAPEGLRYELLFPIRSNVPENNQHTVAGDAAFVPGKFEA
jgi:PAS domain S-box-containing protein